jgi:superfamily II DNA or RNA helicase
LTPHVFLTDEYKKAALARQVPGAYWWSAGSVGAVLVPPDDSGVSPKGWYFDPELHEYGSAVALALFPNLRGDPRLSPPLTGVEYVRPTDLATPWADGRTGREMLPNVPANMLDAMYPFQEIDLGFVSARLRNDGGAVIGWDRGLGKTFGTFALGMELRASRTLIVANRKAKQNLWIPEVEKWDLPITFYDVGGTATQRNRTMANWMMSPDPYPWLIIHPEALRLIEWHNFPVFDMVVFDESHKLAHGGTNRQAGVPRFYKALKTIEAKHRLALSGSIIVNGPEDFFGTLHWILPKRYPRRWKDWNDRYLKYVSGSGHKTLVDVQRDKLDAMKQELGAIMTVRFKNDVLEDVPEVLRQDIYVELGPEQRRVYDEMAEQMLATLPDGSKIRADGVMVQLIRLRQIACGLSLLGDTLDDSVKVEAAIEMVRDNLPHKMVVFSWHRATADALQEAMADLNAAKVYGGMTDRASTAQIARFQEDPDCMVIVGTIKSVGESISLNAAGDVVFPESSWVPSDMDQAADRVAGGLRQLGNKRRISVTRIIAKDTVDVSRVLPALDSKEAIRKLILGG